MGLQGMSGDAGVIAPDFVSIPIEQADIEDDGVAISGLAAFARQVIGRPFIAPPGVSADLKGGVRQAFDATLKDAAFLADADKTKIEINPVSGADVEKLVAQLFRAPPK